MIVSPPQLVNTTKIEPTLLRNNSLYYKIYGICLNTVFASIFPLLSLLYLNIYTVLGELIVFALMGVSHAV